MNFDQIVMMMMRRRRRIHGDDDYDENVVVKTLGWVNEFLPVMVVFYYDYLMKMKMTRMRRMKIEKKIDDDDVEVMVND
jgi:heme/copper-type cytochrome/quinol oxidase subunit 2